MGTITCTLADDGTSVGVYANNGLTTNILGSLTHVMALNGSVVALYFKVTSGTGTITRTGSSLIGSMTSLGIGGT